MPKKQENKVYAPTFPPLTEDQVIPEKTVQSQHRSSNLEKKPKDKQSKKDQDFRLLIEKQQDETRSILRQLSKRDIDEDEAVPLKKSTAKKVNTGWCGQRRKYKYVDPIFRRKPIRKNFIKNASLFIAMGFLITLILIIIGGLWFIKDLLKHEVRLIMAVASGWWVGTNVLGRLVRSKSIIIVCLILRAVSLGVFFICAEILVEETLILLMGGHFEEEIDLNHLKTHLDLNYTLIVTGYPEGGPREVFTRAYIFGLLFAGWTGINMSIFITLQFFSNKINDIHGKWMMQVGIPAGIFPTLIYIIYQFISGTSKYHIKTWDVVQVYLGFTLVFLEAIWLPIRWKNTFSGRIMKVHVEDTIFVAFYLSF